MWFHGKNPHGSIRLSSFEARFSRLLLVFWCVCVCFFTSFLVFGGGSSCVSVVVVLGSGSFPGRSLEESPTAPGPRLPDRHRQVLSFTSAKAEGAFSFAVFGDMGCSRWGRGAGGIWLAASCVGSVKERIGRGPSNRKGSIPSFQGVPPRQKRIVAKNNKKT